MLQLRPDFPSSAPSALANTILRRKVASYYSPDGANWSLLGTQTASMVQNVYIGLAVTSASSTSLATATFDNVSISSTSSPVITGLSPATGPVGTQVTISGTGFGASAIGSSVTLGGSPLLLNSWSDTSIVATIPAGAMSGPLLVSVAPSLNSSNALMFTIPVIGAWLNQDIGATGMMGGASYANGAFTVKGAGHLVADYADIFQFVYQPLSGDGTIMARVVSAQGLVNNGIAGIMIRDALTPGGTNCQDVLQAGSQ